jgi:hypothetical protein
MKKILIFLFLFSCLVGNATTYYLAPTTATPAGSDANAGTIGAPMFTLNHAWTHIVAGDTLLLRGGDYLYQSRQRLELINGTITDTICIFAYPGEFPNLTKGSPYTDPGQWPKSLIWLRYCDYTYWKGIEISHFAQEDTYMWGGMTIYESENTNIENFNINHCGSGLLITYNCRNTFVKNSDFYHNYDPLTPVAYDNADGIGIGTNAGDQSSGTFRGCRFWNNSDDGIDLYGANGVVTIDSCWAWNNGFDEAGNRIAGNGFKLGATTGDGVTVLRTVTNCLAYRNNNTGISTNNSNCGMHIYNNTIYANGRNDLGYVCSGIFIYLFDVHHIWRNNISFDNVTENYYFYETDPVLRGTLPVHSIIDHNSYDDVWQPTGPVATTADFVSVDSTGLSGARQANHSLPVLTFLHLVTGSDLKDAGTYVNIPFYGVHPDLGAFEFVKPPLITGRKILIINR